MTKYSADDFDFESEYAKAKAEIKKPNILLCGATGAGKSSLINDIFNRHITKVGVGKPVTEGIRRCEEDDINVVLYDSEGYEIGGENQKCFRNNVLSILDKGYSYGTLKENIHEVWYFINAANKRVTDTDIQIIKEIQRRKVPVSIVVTQIDNVDLDELNSILYVIKHDLSGIPFFTVCVSQDKYVLNALKKYNNKDGLIRWAVDNLEDSLKIGLVSAIYKRIDLKKELIKNKIVPAYVASAAAAVAIPIPVADSVALTTIQLTMCLHIMNIYGIDKLKGAASAVIESSIIPQIGRSIARFLTTSLIKMVPGVGTFAEIAVNTTTATSITTALGLCLSEVCSKYLEAVADDKNPNILEYFNFDIFEERFKEFFENIKKENIHYE